MSRRASTLVALTLLGLVGLVFGRSILHEVEQRQQDLATIRHQYTELRAALSAKDTNAARLLFVPEYRGGAHRSFELLAGFAKPLKESSQLRVRRRRAEICPEPLYQGGAYSGGHTIEIVKRDGSWYFTGKVHVD